MKPDQEKKLYPHVATWLQAYLKSRYPRAEVSAHDTHKTELGSFLRDKGLHGHFQGSSAFEIQVDVTGVVQASKSAFLALVECKTTPITLRDVGQLLGYSLVAQPEWAYLLSPAGLSDRLKALLGSFGRQDILNYSKNRYLRLATWDLVRNEVDVATIIPKGNH